MAQRYTLTLPSPVFRFWLWTHFNPIVPVAFSLTREICERQLDIYAIAQFARGHPPCIRCTRHVCEVSGLSTEMVSTCSRRRNGEFDGTDRDDDAEFFPATVPIMAVLMTVFGGTRANADVRMAVRLIIFAGYRYIVHVLRQPVPNGRKIFRIYLRQYQPQVV